MNDDQIKIQQLENQVASLKDELKNAYQHLNQMYSPPKGVIGYARKEELDEKINDGSSYYHIGLDHPSCWEEEARYPWLVALCAVDSLALHNVDIIQEAQKQVRSKLSLGDGANDYDALLTDYIHRIKTASGIT